MPITILFLNPNEPAFTGKLADRSPCRVEYPDKIFRLFPGRFPGRVHFFLSRYRTSSNHSLPENRPVKLTSFNLSTIMNPAAR